MSSRFIESGVTAVTPENVIEAYLRNPSLATVRDATYYADECGPQRVLAKKGVVLQPQQRPPISLSLREAAYSLSVLFDGHREAVSESLGPDGPSPSTIGKIIRRRTERSPGVLGTAALVTDRDGEKVLICRERGAAAKYGKEIGDRTIPMITRGRKENWLEAMKRLLQTELFASSEGVAMISGSWDRLVGFPYDREPLGSFWIADALVDLWVVLLLLEPESLGGFRSYKVDGFEWVNPEEIVEGDQERHFRRGAVKMVEVYRSFLNRLKRSERFSWGEVYFT